MVSEDFRWLLFRTVSTGSILGEILNSIVAIQITGNKLEDQQRILLNVRNLRAEKKLDLHF